MTRFTRLAAFGILAALTAAPTAFAQSEPQRTYRKEKNFEDLTPAEHTAAKAEARTRKLKALVVCADPGNMPLSNNKREGFQNKIAETLARAMGTEVIYFWRPYLERGLTRETFDNRECDVLMDMPLGYVGVLTTEPIYRTTYVFAYRNDRGLDIKSLDDPKLKDLKIGVFQHSGLRHILTRRGLSKNVRIHVISQNADIVPENQPWRQVQKVVDGELDMAGVWGPFAGYVKTKLGAPLTLSPANLLDDQVQLEFDLTIGMRPDDVVLKYMLDNALTKSKDEIGKILADYGVPLVQCSKCTVPGDIPSHGSYYQKFSQTSQSRYLEFDTNRKLSADAAADQRVDTARLEGWLADGADLKAELGNAVLASDIERVKVLVAKGADLDAIGPQGYNPLQAAARHRDTPMIEGLLDLKADINRPDPDGWTPLMHAAHRNHVPSVKALAERGADLEATTPGKVTVLAMAISDSKFWAAKALMDAGAKVDARIGQDGLTPLMISATQIEPATRDGNIAQGPGAIATAEDLIARGADVNAATGAGVTALMVAATHNNAPMIGVLLRAGAKPDAKNSNGKTALDLANQTLNDDAIKALKLLGSPASN